MLLDVPMERLLIRRALILAGSRIEGSEAQLKVRKWGDRLVMQLGLLLCRMGSFPWQGGAHG